jgi:putative DNA primase/helicase
MQRDIPRAAWAHRYVSTLGAALVQIPPGEKAPKTPGWQKPGGQFTDPDQAAAFWEQHPDHNMGVVLGPSQWCSLDIDDVPASRVVFRDVLGLDLDELAETYPTVVGNPERFRIMLRVPAGVELTRHALAWPKEEGAGNFTVVEFRAGPVQDVLPPSIHPGTGKPYTWRTPPVDGVLPELPELLLSAWQNWDIFKREALRACPWFEPTTDKPAPARAPSPKGGRADAGESVIEAFNRAHDIEQLLAAQGYRKRGTRWLYPHSSTGLPGINIVEGCAYSHHASDPLNTGHLVDPFELFRLLEHNGDMRAAVREAARLLGMDAAPRALPPAPSEGQPSEAPAAGGAGVAPLGESDILRRFALLVGEKKVMDLDRRRVMKWSAFEALVTKEQAKAWLDRGEKKLIDAEDALRTESLDKLNRKLTAGDAEGGMSAIERYVFLDGTQDIWDRLLKARLPSGAVKLALGDAFSLWVNSPQRKQIPSDHLVFDPRMQFDPEAYINTFDGLPLEPVDAPDRCETIRYLIHWLCNGDRAAMHWMTCWLAYPLQNLGAKLDTAILAHSTVEGSGKSLLLSDIMGEIYGQYAATVGQTQLESNWNQWQERKLYGVFEEVVSRDQRYNQVGKIKHMITGKTVRVEAKFVNGWEQANYMNAAFLSNEIMPWPISEHDRRMLVIWPEKTLPKEATQALGKELAEGGVAAFYHYLLSYDTDDFDERTRPPNTAAREHLVAMSRASWETFLVAWREGLLGVPFDVARTQDVHDLFLEWCSKNREHALSETKFSLFISKSVNKTPGQLGWYTMQDERRRSKFFLADPPHDLDISDGRALGGMVKRFRDAAKAAGWNPLSWDKCDGWQPPMGSANDDYDPDMARVV